MVIFGEADDALLELGHVVKLLTPYEIRHFVLLGLKKGPQGQAGLPVELLGLLDFVQKVFEHSVQRDYQPGEGLVPAALQEHYGPVDDLGQDGLPPVLPVDVIFVYRVTLHQSGGPPCNLVAHYIYFNLVPY